MSGHVVKYEVPTVIKSVLAYRESDMRPAQIYRQYDITPKILRFRCQKYSKIPTKKLRRVLEIYPNRGGDRNGQLAGVGITNQ